MDSAGRRVVKRRASGSASYGRRSERSRKNRKNGKSYNDQDPELAVKFFKLEMTSLKKYQQLYGLDVPLNCSKTQLVDSVSKHFLKSQKSREVDIISDFLNYVRKNKDT